MIGITSCTCSNPAFPVLGRPNCVIRKKKTAFPILRPRFKDGVRNTIDLTSGTLGADIQALVQPSTDSLERLYPFPKIEEATYDLTDPVYQTFASGTKFLLEGEGNVRTVSFMLPADSGVEQIARELEATGCTEMDFYEATVDGNLWGVVDDPDAASPVMRGYAIQKETFHYQIVRAQDGQINGVMVSFDLEDELDNTNSYAITAGELGYKANTTLTPLVRATCSIVETSSTSITATVIDGFGSAVTDNGVLGLATANFTVVSDTGSVTVTATEVGNGVYTLAHSDLEITIGDTVTCSVSATGYDVSDGTFVAAL
jgi:hypothetical protein